MSTVLLGSVALLATTAHAQAGARRERLDIAVEDEADPWSRKNGTGYANDIVRAAFAAANVDVRLMVTPYARCKQMVVQGTVAACFSMSEYPGRSKDVIFAPSPLFVIRSALIELAAGSVESRSAGRSAAPKRVGVVRGYEYPDKVYGLETSRSAIFDYSASESINIRKLFAHRLDAVVVNLDQMKTLPHVLALAKVKGNVQTTAALGEMAAFIGFSRKHPKAGWALERYTAGLAHIAANGEADSIRVAWERSMSR